MLIPRGDIIMVRHSISGNVTGDHFLPLKRYQIVATVVARVPCSSVNIGTHMQLCMCEGLEGTEPT